MAINVTTTVRQLVDADLWDRCCELSGIDQWALSEGKLDYEDTVTVPSEIVGELLQWSQTSKPAASGKFPLRTKLYLHGSKDSNWEKAEELGLSEEASRHFAYALSEVEFDVEVDEDGTCRIITVDGKTLAA